MTRIRNEEFIDSHVRSSLHGLGCKSVEKFVTPTTTIVWSCGKFTVICYAGDIFLERMSDTELAEYVVSTLRHRIEKNIS